MVDGLRRHQLRVARAEHLAYYQVEQEGKAERNAQMLRERERGDFFKDISARHGVSMSCVQNAVHRLTHGTRRTNRRTEFGW